MNYQLALVSLPGIVFGAIVGYIANKMCYDLVLVGIMLLVQIRAVVKNITKVQQLEAKEKESLLTQRTNLNESFP